MQATPTLIDKLICAMPNDVYLKTYVKWVVVASKWQKKANPMLK